MGKLPFYGVGMAPGSGNFLKDVNWLSQLKLRLGFGITGNAAIAAYATKGAITGLYYNWGQTDSSLGYVPSDPSAKNPAKMANQDLGWEKQLSTT